jgi:Zn-finger protein
MYLTDVQVIFEQSVKIRNFHETARSSQATRAVLCYRQLSDSVLYMCQEQRLMVLHAGSKTGVRIPCCYNCHVVHRHVNVTTGTMCTEYKEIRGQAFHSVIPC